MKWNRFIYILPVLAAMLLFSCTDELPEDATDGLQPVPDGKVRLEVFTNADEFQKPVTRTGNADENTVGATPWIFVFRGTDDNAVFYEAVQAHTIGGKSYVTLTETTQPSVLILMANAPATFYDGTGDATFDAAHLHAYFTEHPALGDAMNTLSTSRLATPNQTSVPYAASVAPYPTIPMTGRYDVSSISKTTTIGTSASKVMLKRAVAKVTLESASLPGFTLVAATVMHVPRNGRLYQSAGGLKDNTGNTTDYLTTTTGDGMIGIAAATGGSTSKNPIYLYETRKEDKPYLLFRANYNAGTYYYRLAFADDNGTVDLLRNKYYKIIITSVTGIGYTSMDEARTGTAMNFRYRIEVTDQTSSDIQDNGLYYMGVSNSAFYLFEDAAVSGNVVAVTVTTDATADMDIGSNSITASTTAGPAFSVSPSTINLASSAGEVGTTEVRITIPAYTTTSTSGTITLKLGNLTKSIRVGRQASMSAIAFPQLYSSNSVSATITSGSSWFSASADDLSPGASELTLPAPGPIYLTATPNVVESGGAVRTGGEAYLATSVASDGRFKIVASQKYTVIGQQTSVSNQYTGAFYRWNQSGERLIRIPVVSGMTGVWTAQVVKGDFIVVDSLSTSDAGVTYNTATESPANMNDPANDALYHVNTLRTLARGNVSSGANSYIRFRVGLTSTLPGGAGSAPRYGVIALAYNGNTKYMYIYVRQGENPDYVMRPEDPVNSGGMTSSTRPLARRFSPFNLTDLQKTTGMVDLGTQGGAFCEYPSQGGYYFQWGGTKAWYPMGSVVSWNTTAYTSYWSANPSWETCPQGYHRPNDGSTSTAVSPTTVLTSASELRQSLFANPAAGSAQTTSNVITGYYADGYFDRREVVASSTGVATSMAGSGADVAYTGQLFFNPTTKASVFLPAAGNRTTAGALNGVGLNTYIYTSSGTLPSGTYEFFGLNTASLTTNGSTLVGMSLRCVADP